MLRRWPRLSRCVERTRAGHPCGVRQDMGIVVNPDGAKMQMEGGITMGLGYSLSEELRFRGGDILDRNFDTYDIPRFSWVPVSSAYSSRTTNLLRRAAVSRRLLPPEP